MMLSKFACSSFLFWFVCLKSVQAEIVQDGGRVWAQCSYGQKLQENFCSGEPIKVAFSDVSVVLAEINSRYDTTHGKWVLPSVYDLASIIHCGSGVFRSRDIVFLDQEAIDNWCMGDFVSPTIDPSKFFGIVAGIYWTGTAANRRLPSSWVVNFKDGYIMDHPNSHSFYLHFIWSGSQVPKINKLIPEAKGAVVKSMLESFKNNRFEISENGEEIFDVNLGLHWKRCSYGQSWNGQSCTGTPLVLSLDSAEDVVRKVNKDDGHDSQVGWRLPTLREVMSLVYCSSEATRFLDDPGDGGDKIPNWCHGSFRLPTIDIALFPDTPARRYWTSTPYQSTQTANWGVLFNNGRMSADIRSEKNHVRLVRNVKP